MLVKSFMVVVLIFVFSGCATPFNFPSLPKNQPQQKFHQSETFKSKPVIIKKDGDIIHIGEEVTQTFDTGLEKTKPKASIFSKLMALGIGWVILMGLGMIFPPIALIMGVVNRGASKVTQKVVMGVERGLDRMDNKEAKEKLLKDMKDGQDPVVHSAIKKIKESIK